MPQRKVKKHCTFTAPELQNLLRQLKSKEQQSLHSREYMQAVKQRLVAQYQERLDKQQVERQEAEAARMQNLLEMKMIRHRDVSEDTCMLIDEKVVSFAKSKRSSRRCDSPPRKETMLDPIHRYHTSVIADPFGVLDIEKPTPNIVCDLTDTDNITATYTKHYSEETLQRMTQAESVNELYELAEKAVLRTSDGCKDLVSG